MDSSGIALIIGRCEVASAVSASVLLIGLSPQLSKLVRLAGIERISNLVIKASEI
jgi:anti-anti-sigma regulatory factor